MAAPSQTSYNSSTGNGVTTVFPYTFKILQDSDLQVLVDGVEQTLTTHYTVSGAGVDAGGNVTFITAPANGATVVRRRDMAIARTGTDYQYQGDIPSDVLNDDQDAPILMLQQLQEQINRALRLPAGDTAAEFDAADDRADLLPMFNTTTGALELSDFTATQLRDMIANGYGSGSLGVSGFIATLLDDANAAAARATLGSTTVGDALFIIASAAAARALISAAVSGANGDITSLTGLTTAISGESLGDKIQPITASVAANALTITLNPTTLDFRSATVGSGTVSTVKVGAAISVVVPDTATLGTVNATAARLAVLAINNAGTAELAVINLAGGVALDETGVISTTTIGTGADLSTVAYSTTGRSNVAYRVVGFLDITEATAGTWATAPSTIQGAGGQALAALSSLGYGQTWQNVGGSRSTGTTYYNTTGKPIVVSVIMNINVSVSAKLTVGGVDMSQVNNNGSGSNTQTICGVVPPGQSYVVTSTGTVSLWLELR